jgi:hypothetical protein
MTEMQNTRYVTSRDAIEQAIIPALDGDEYDIDAIFREAFRYRVDTDGHGNELLNTAGFEQIVDDAEFWQIIERTRAERALIDTTDRRPPYGAVSSFRAVVRPVRASGTRGVSSSSRGAASGVTRARTAPPRSSVSTPMPARRYGVQLAGRRWAPSFTVSTAMSSASRLLAQRTGSRFSDRIPAVSQTSTPLTSL